MGETVDRATTGLDRLAAFSDGVFAIAITLLVLPLADADIDVSDVGGSLVALLPRMLTFVLSFAVIGRYWAVHHDEVRRLVRSDRGLLSLNLLFLFTVAFLPFPTSVLGQSDDSAAATILYAVNITAASLAGALLWWYAFRRKLTDAAVISPAVARSGLAGGLAAAVAVLPSVPLAFVDPGWAKLSWLLLLPFGVIAKRLFPGEPSAST